MAGILDNKKRVMDTLITAPGRSQAASGHMQFRYVTFTDRHAFYDGEISPTASNIADDAGDRLYFEAAKRPQDTIALETNLNGQITFENFNLKPGGTSIEGLVNQGQYYTVNGAFPVGVDVNPLQGGIPEQIVQGLTASYKEQHFLASLDPFALNNEFLVSTASIGFRFTDKKITPGCPNLRPLSQLPHVWNDPRFYNKHNFMFLPPINKLPVGVKMTDILPYILMNQDLNNMSYNDFTGILGYFGSFDKPQTTWVEMVGYDGMGGGQIISEWGLYGGLSGLFGPYSYNTDLIPHKLTSLKAANFPADQTASPFNETFFNMARLCFMGVYDYDVGNSPGFYAADGKVGLSSRLGVFVNQQKSKFKSNLNWTRVNFKETSAQNNIIMQMFEFPKGTNEISKLAMIDGGVLIDKMAYGNDQRVFYVGKLYWDNVSSLGEPQNVHFANIFTIVMHTDIYEKMFLKDELKTKKQLTPTQKLDSMCNLTS